MDAINAAVQAGDASRLKTAINALSASERAEVVQTDAGKVRILTRNPMRAVLAALRLTEAVK